MKNYLIFGLVTTTTLLFSARKNDENKMGIDDLKLSYFPIDSGLIRYYQTNSVYGYEFAHIRATISNSIKEEIAGMIPNNRKNLNIWQLALQIPPPTSHLKKPLKFT